MVITSLSTHRKVPFGAGLAYLEKKGRIVAAWERITLRLHPWRI